MIFTMRDIPRVCVLYFIHQQWLLFMYVFVYVSMNSLFIVKNPCHLRSLSAGVSAHLPRQGLKIHIISG